MARQEGACGDSYDEGVMLKEVIEKLREVLSYLDENKLSMEAIHTSMALDLLVARYEKTSENGDQA